MLRIIDLWMELQTKAITRRILHALYWAGFAQCRDSVAWWGFCNLIIVALPNRLFDRGSLKDGASSVN